MFRRFCGATLALLVVIGGCDSSSDPTTTEPTTGDGGETRCGTSVYDGVPRCYCVHGDEQLPDGSSAVSDCNVQSLAASAVSCCAKLDSNRSRGNDICDCEPWACKMEGAFCTCGYESTGNLSSCFAHGGHCCGNGQGFCVCEQSECSGITPVEVEVCDVAHVPPAQECGVLPGGPMDPVTSCKSAFESAR
ncbi:MAG TPA: hypothetical protein VGM56_09345 [Byssovorax sp.]|jgi:hypothetical protein